MKDVSTWMIELVDAVNIDGHYFSVIRLQLDGIYYKLRFGILPEDYSRLRYILTYRSFENTSFGPYRYFYSLSYQIVDKNKETLLVDVRIERLKQDKKIQFPLGKQCLANLIWFHEIKDKKVFTPFIIP